MDPTTVKLVNWVEDVKHKLTDNEYKTYLEALAKKRKTDKTLVEIEYISPDCHIHFDENEDDCHLMIRWQFVKTVIFVSIDEKETLTEFVNYRNNSHDFPPGCDQRFQQILRRNNIQINHIKCFHPKVLCRCGPIFLGYKELEA